jgi:hypothetical protein
MLSEGNYIDINSTHGRARRPIECQNIVFLSLITSRKARYTMLQETTKTNRPSSITLISVLAIYATFLSFYFILRGEVQGIGNTLFFALGGIIFLVCGIGFWLMKKWAVYVYAMFALIDQIVLLLMGRWTLMALLIPAIVVYVGYKHLSKMS